MRKSILIAVLIFGLAGLGISYLMLWGGGAKNQPPTVEIANPPDGAELIVGQGIRFEADATDPEGKPPNFSWDFGDGSKSSEQNPKHTYQYSGDYTIALTVSDPKGAKAEASLTIHVIEPTADIDGKWEITLLNTEWTGAAEGAMELHRVKDRLVGSMSTAVSTYHISGNCEKDKIIMDLKHTVYAERSITLEGTLYNPTGMSEHYWSETGLGLPNIPFKLGTQGEWYARKPGGEACELTGTWSLWMQQGWFGKGRNYTLWLRALSGSKSLYGTLTNLSSSSILNLRAERHNHDITIFLNDSTDRSWKFAGRLFKVDKCTLVGNIYYYSADDQQWYGKGSWRAVKPISQ